MYWFLKWVLVGPFVRLLARPTVTGHLPKRGPVVLAPNHRTEIESVVLGVALRRRITYVAKSDYFDRGALGARLYGLLCRATGQIPIIRSGNGVADPALDAARGLLDRGGVWAIYPEGTRSPDGRLYRGHTGVMRVALSRPDATVIPVGILGAETVGLGRPGRVEIRLGAPLDLSRWHGRADDPQAWREATDALMREIRELTQQEYVDRHPTVDEVARRNAA
ncbi:1-acyl-sn-glycerol-3-phosphate acyltransferase [Nocardioides terrae]|uniref:1-acyl-sn-glycerol-3-phosphate acyltransferase n=1 Tax=Nocardioides terrae TaxID=574651 RepID=A0A1I1IKM3_9ACTN|nr:lysophospholipid acyltransferase family protein [Nocardioides terrae]SFC34323.1 1-acyl-sn-glycerol-3-phosphate acyltransferase [Nocardioides terrae]